MAFVNFLPVLWLGVAKMPRLCANYAVIFAKHALLNARCATWNVVLNVRKLVVNVLKNVKKW